MSIVTIEDTNLTNIADAIRSKSNTTTTYKPNEMASAIQAISTGENLSVELTEQDNLLTIQEITIDNIMEALEDKSAGGGGITPSIEGNILILSGANVEGGVLSI